MEDYPTPRPKLRRAVQGAVKIVSPSHEFPWIESSTSMLTVSVLSRRRS